VFLLLGVVCSSKYGTSREGQLKPGQSMVVRGYTLTYERSFQRQAGDATQVRAVVDVSQGGHHVATMYPGKDNFPIEQQVSNAAAIRSNWKNGEDLFLIAEDFRGGGAVVFKALVKPLVNLIWLSGFVFLAGSLIALWPDAREERRLVARYGVVPAEA